ncbi:RagB/SusD family nutrient uptake outer membrane protein [Chitinophaga arvensicola]|uniref:SusD family protein n=1 Tax=Chitinophaga arvensicola TaxID=29529 RepID=A0A1I0SBB9_9BACT|nr:RagB/SusD family nutrient uptake outer membrane protein [Chitinophaga arvensicola]SEW53986.1 SusD family protein [Chitinophaga arvensicola]
MNRLKYFGWILIALFFSSCRKYVDITPQGKIVPTTVADFRLLLNNSDVFNLAGGTTDLMTDDIAFTDTAMYTGVRPQSVLNIYSWAETNYLPSEDDEEWNLYYKQVYYSNVVITGINGVKDGDEEEKQALISEAKVHRAFAYLMLVNQYAVQYDAATASKDAGVPLLLEPGYTQHLQRASVQQVYQQVLDDLLSAVKALPELPASKIHASRAAAFALLARTYLYMRNYPSALMYADSTLNLQPDLYDLRTFANTNNPLDFMSIPEAYQHPEVILMKAAYNQDGPLALSPELLNLLGPDDLRRKVFGIGDQLLFEYDGIFFSYISPFEARQVGPRVGEMYVTKAECEARAGQAGTAMTTLNALRIKRFTTDKYIPLTATDATDALHKVLDERRRELMGRGYRLADLKRLNKEPALAKTITHPWSSGNITLAPNSNRYIYPVATKILAANPEIGQSPR